MKTNDDVISECLAVLSATEALVASVTEWIGTDSVYVPSFRRIEDFGHFGKMLNAQEGLMNAAIALQQTTRRLIEDGYPW